MHRIWSVVDNWGSIVEGDPVSVDGGESPLPPPVLCVKMLLAAPSLMWMILYILVWLLFPIRIKIILPVE